MIFAEIISNSDNLYFYTFNEVNYRARFSKVNIFMIERKIPRTTCKKFPLNFVHTNHCGAGKKLCHAFDRTNQRMKIDYSEDLKPNKIRMR